MKYPTNTLSLKYFLRSLGFNFVQLRKFRAEIEHYHANGGKELISKEVLGILKGIGASYSWSLTDTPELNGVSERKFKTLGERCLYDFASWTTN